ncbi:hypothetical protein [Fuerstiella marisgermanici]|uniref:Uncharacterized protein n=1 Tax=Fuerstiella marisgermanici TaxID=1891926 RepID=A0A1P8WH89_9PLAN|nr:hypothetical protein [Fuerstiella marisgermanici]APZ93415.1 hypothetical protein Fuma_03032 [Fuerstiella marisgermanici]
MARHESNSILERAGIASEISNPEADYYNEDDPYRAIGISRKAWGGEPMINFIMRTGDHQAIAYNHLYRIQFDPSKGITLDFTNHKVVIQGRKLAEAYQKLAMQRVIFIAEADDATGRLADDDEPVVTSLQILEPTSETPIR